MSTTTQLTTMVALGSALGGMTRQACRDVLAALGIDMLAVSTLTVNVSGSILIGLLAGATATGAMLPLPERHRQFLMGGFCGGLTTFSIFSADVVHLHDTHGLALSLGYVAATLVLSLFGCWIGLVLVGRGRSAG